MEDRMKTKLLLELVLEAYKAVDQARKTGDGIGVEDIPLFIPVLTKVVPAFDALEEAAAELKSLTVEDASKLAAFIQAEVSFDDKDLEEKVKVGVALLLNTFAFIRMFKK